MLSALSRSSYSHVDVLTRPRVPRVMSYDILTKPAADTADSAAAEVQVRFRVRGDRDAATAEPFSRSWKCRLGTMRRDREAEI